MTGTLAGRVALRITRTSYVSDRRVIAWTVQALLPWALTVVHPSAWSLTSATAQLMIGGSLLLASGARLRWVAQGTAALAVVGNGIDLSHLLGGLAQVVTGGLESALLVAAVALLRGARRSPVVESRSRW